MFEQPSSPTLPDATVLPFPVLDLDDWHTPLDYPRLPQSAVPAAAIGTARGIARALAEVLVGARSPVQLARWLTPDGSQRLAAWLAVTPVTRAPLVRSRLTLTGPSRVEAVLTFSCGPRFVVAALRLDATDRAWTCHDLELVLPGRAGCAMQRWDCGRDRP